MIGAEKQSILLNFLVETLIFLDSGYDLIQRDKISLMLGINFRITASFTLGALMK